MKIVKATGLVPVKVANAAAFDNRLDGEVFGVHPKAVKELVDKGFVALVDIPGDVETEEADASESTEEKKPVDPMKATPKKPAGADAKDGAEQ